MGFYRILLF